MVARLRYGAVVGNRSCDRSVALSRMYFDLRFSCTQGKPLQTSTVGWEFGFGIHMMVITTVA